MNGVVGNGDAEAVGPQTCAIGHHILEERSFEVPASGVQTGCVWSERVEALFHRPYQREGFD